MISGLVVHLSPKDDVARSALDFLQQRDGIELGSQVGQCLPMVVESTQRASAEVTTEWIRELPGVLHVDVTFVHFDEDLDCQPPGRTLNTCQTRSAQQSL